MYNNHNLGYYQNSESMRVKARARENYSKVLKMFSPQNTYPIVRHS